MGKEKPEIVIMRRKKKKNSGKNVGLERRQEKTEISV